MTDDLKKVFETFNPNEANLVKAKLDDEEIHYFVKGDSNLAMTMDTFNAELSRMALKQPIRFYVNEEDFDKVKILIETDNSGLLTDDLEY